MEQKLYYTFSDHLKKKYGEKVYKLPVNLPVGCPNREDGYGCAFCDGVGTGFEAMESYVPVTEQLCKTKEKIEKKYKAHKFIAYFQNYTNTFLPLDTFRKYMNEAAQIPDIVEISISTRPDCIRDDYLEVLRSISNEHDLAITIELGLQSCNYHTLESIQRGHGLAEYLDACLRIKKYGFFLCTHIILNLPGDSLLDVKETSKIVSIMGNDLVKIHSLYIAKGTRMADDFLQNKFNICSKEEYFIRLKCFLEHLDPNIGVERIFSRIPEKDSLFSNWSTSWWKLQDEFFEFMNEHESYQGKAYLYRNGSALRLLDTKTP